MPPSNRPPVVKDARFQTAQSLGQAQRRAPEVHTHTVAQVSGAAPLASPALTGTPTTSVPASDDDSTRIACTSWVLDRIGEVDVGELADVAYSGEYTDLIGRPLGTGWSNPSGSGFNKGSFNADDETSVSPTPTGSEVTEISNRLKDTRAVIRAMILELKTIGIFS